MDTAQIFRLLNAVLSLLALPPIILLLIQWTKERGLLAEKVRDTNLVLIISFYGFLFISLITTCTYLYAFLQRELPTVLPKMESSLINGLSLISRINILGFSWTLYYLGKNIK